MGIHAYVAVLFGVENCFKFKMSCDSEPDFNNCTYIDYEQELENLEEGVGPTDIEC